MTKTKSPKKHNHVLHEGFPRETRERQPPSQWGYGEGYERCVSLTLLLVLRVLVNNLEVLEIWEEADEIQDLSTRPAWLFEGE